MALELADGGLDGVHGEFHEGAVFHALDADDVAAFDAGFPAKEPAVLTPLDALSGDVPGDVVAALRAAGLPNVQMVRRLSSREAGALDGVGDAGRAALRAWFRARGVAWGPAQPAASR